MLSAAVVRGIACSGADQCGLVLVLPYTISSDCAMDNLLHGSYQKWGLSSLEKRDRMAGVRCVATLVFQIAVLVHGVPYSA